MSFVAQFFLLVLVVGTSELFLLLRVAASMGFVATAVLCVLTGVIGGSLVRAQGLETIWKIQRLAQQGRSPANEIAGGAVLLLVGALLIVPGFLTDLFGFAMLIPPLRQRVAATITARVMAHVTIVNGGDIHRGDVIDIEPD